jgi:hypothetical protein
VTSLEEREPEVIGNEGRSASGRLRADITASKRSFSLSFVADDPSVVNNLRTATSLGQAVPFTGDCVGGSTLTVRVRFRSMPYARIRSGFTKDAQIELVEV